MPPTPALFGQTRSRRAPLPLPTGAPIGSASLELLPSPDGQYRLVRAFVQLVDQQFRTLKVVSAYAAQLSVSPNHLNARCRRLLHHTASDVLHARIVAEAQQQLARPEHSVAAIAAALGFADASYFCRYFKKYLRQTPRTFRESRAAA